MSFTLVMWCGGLPQPSLGVAKKFKLFIRKMTTYFYLVFVFLVTMVKGWPQPDYPEPSVLVHCRGRRT